MAAPEDSLPEKNGAGCELCGRPLTPRELRYAIYCPSCGALNYLESRKDFYTGRCAQCSSPFRLPVVVHPRPRREVAYPVFAAILTALIWILFFSCGGKPRPEHGLKFPVPAQSHPGTEKNPPSVPAAGKVKKLPLPRASIPANKPALPPASVFPQAAPSKVVGAPRSVASKAANVPRPEAARVGPAVPAGGTASKTSAEKPAETEKIAPEQSRSRFNQGNNKSAGRLSREKSTGPRQKSDDLLDIPLPHSTGEPH